MSVFKESDMYAPVEKMLEDMGYSVQAEVKSCDITASKNGETIVIEMKKAFTMKLVYQLIDRQTFAKNVYACIPRGKGTESNDVLRLLKRLDAGLISVAMDSPLRFAQIIIEPSGMRKITNSRKKKALEKEVLSRSENLNTGGVSQSKLITAYREKTIEILCLCEKTGILTKKILAKLGYDEKTYGILYRNYYKWFKKDKKTGYSLSDDGRLALADERYAPLTAFYKNAAQELLSKTEQ